MFSLGGLRRFFTSGFTYRKCCVAGQEEARGNCTDIRLKVLLKTCQCVVCVCMMMMMISAFSELQGLYIYIHTHACTHMYVYVVKIVRYIISGVFVQQYINTLVSSLRFPSVCRKLGLCLVLCLFVFFFICMDLMRKEEMKMNARHVKFISPYADKRGST